MHPLNHWERYGSPLFPAYSTEQILLFPHILVLCVYISRETFPSLFICLFVFYLLLVVELGIKRPLIFDCFLSQLGTEESRKEGLKEGAAAISIWEGNPLFISEFTRLWFLLRVTKQGSETTIGFTVIHQWAFLYITQVTVPMQLVGILKEAKCTIDYWFKSVIVEYLEVLQ